MLFLLPYSLNPTSPVVEQIKSIIILPINQGRNATMTVGQLNAEERELSTKKSQKPSSFKPTEPKKARETPLSY